MRFSDEKAELAVRSAARAIARTMRMEWDPGLWAEMRTCLAEWRFGDALLIAGELEARQRYGCAGSVTTPGAEFRLTEEWLEQREAEIATLFGLRIEPLPPAGDDLVRARHARLGLAK